MLCQTLVLSLAAIASATIQPVEQDDLLNHLAVRDGPDQDVPILHNHVIWQPKVGQRVSYPRFVELEDGKLLVTASVSGLVTPPVFPVWQSVDKGRTWEWISNITDQVNGWGFGAQARSH